MSSGGRERWSSQEKDTKTSAMASVSSLSSRDERELLLLGGDNPEVVFCGEGGREGGMSWTTFQEEGLNVSRGMVQFLQSETLTRRT